MNTNTSTFTVKIHINKVFIPLILILNCFCKNANSQYDTIQYLPALYVSDAMKNATSSCRDHYLVISTLENNSFDVNLTDGNNNPFVNYSVITGTSSTPGTLNISINNPAILQFNNTGVNVDNIISASDLNSVITTENLIMESNKPFFANIRHLAGSQSGSLTLKGNSAIGNEFITGFQYMSNHTNHANKQAHFISIMATEDNTNVTVSNFKPGVNFIGQPSSGSPATSNNINISLNRGQSYVIAQEKDQMVTTDHNDYNGILINSDRNIVVNSGSWLSSSSGGSRDIGIDQLIPTKLAGNKYGLIKGLGSNTNERIVVISTKPGITTINFGSGASINLNGIGDYSVVNNTYWQNASPIVTSSSSHSNLAFTSTKPVLAFQTLLGSSANNTSSMNLIPPLAPCIGSDSIYIPNATQFGTNSRVNIISQVTSTIKIEDETGTTLLNIPPQSENLPGTIINDYRTTSYSIPSTVNDILITGDDKFTLGFLGASGAAGGAGYLSAFSIRDIDLLDAPALFNDGGNITLDLCEANPSNIIIEDSLEFESFQWYENNLPIAKDTFGLISLNTPGTYYIEATYCSFPLQSDNINVNYIGSPGNSGFSKTAIVLESEIFDGNTNNSNITTWNDKSKHLNFLFAPANQPQINQSFSSPSFHPAVYFNDNNTEYLKTNDTLANINGSTNFCFFLVLKDSATNNNESIISLSNELTGPRIIKVSSGYQFLQGNSTSPSISSSVVTNTEKYNIISGIYNASGMQLFANGKAGTIDNSMTPISIQSSSILGGGAETSGEYFHGHIAEFVFFDTTFSVNKKQEIESYYALKYGITLDVFNDESINDGDYLSSLGTVIWNQTANSSYHNDIAGIGFDDCGRINQKQGKQADNNDILSIGIGSIASNNMNNSNSFSTDDSFLIWGNDQNPLYTGFNNDYGVTINGETLEGRLGRVWKSQETGTLGSVKIRFDLSSVANGTSSFPNVLSNVRLLVDTDNTFSTGALSVAPTSFNDLTGIIEFDHDFSATNGFFFTLGTTDIENTTLPIELISFKASIHHSEEVILEWETATEINNDHFILERSYNGINWEEITQIEGAGNSSQTIYYSFIDKNAFRGHNYYRLKQVDFDGTKTQSSVEHIYLSQKLSEVLIYPNPSEEKFNISIENTENYNIKLIDYTGRELNIKPLRTQNNMVIDLNQFPKGVYFICIISNKNGNSVTKKVVLK